MLRLAQMRLSDLSQSRQTLTADQFRAHALSTRLDRSRKMEECKLEGPMVDSRLSQLLQHWAVLLD